MDRSSREAVHSSISVLNRKHKEPMKRFTFHFKRDKAMSGLYYEITGTLRKYSAIMESCKEILTHSNAQAVICA